MVDRSGYIPLFPEDQSSEPLNILHLLKTEWLSIAEYDTSIYPNTDRPVAYQTFFAMKSLRTLTLTYCSNLPFISALDPNQNASNTVVCPKLEELVLFTQEESCIEELLEMAKGRASRGAKLSLIAITCPQELAPAGKISELRGYALHVEYRWDRTEPEWSAVPGEVEVSFWGSRWY